MYKNSSQTNYRQQLREKILQTSMAEFMSKGKIGIVIHFLWFGNQIISSNK